MKVLIKNEGERPIKIVIALPTKPATGDKEVIVEPNGFAHLSEDEADNMVIREVSL